MRRTLLLIALFVVGAVCVLGQTVTVTSSHFADSAGNLYTGSVTFQPTINGLPTAYHLSTGGQRTSAPVSVYSQAGVFSITLPDTTTTDPANFCFKMTAGTMPGFQGYACLQPHTTATGSGDWCQAGVCNLDNYSPSFPTLAPVWGISSINGINGPVQFSGPGLSQNGNSFFFSGQNGGGSIGDSDVTNQTASQGTVNLVGTTPSAGKYRISYYVSQHTLCVTGANTVQLTFHWSDGLQSRSTNSVALTLNSSASAASIQGVIPIYAAAASAITYTSTLAGSCATGGPSSYDAHISVEAVQ